MSIRVAAVQQLLSVARCDPQCVRSAGVIPGLMAALNFDGLAPSLLSDVASTLAMVTDSTYRLPSSHPSVCRPAMCHFPM